jgi:hypothetical protein
MAIGSPVRAWARARVSPHAVANWTRRGAIRSVGGLEVADQVVDVRAVVPDVEFRHRRVLAHAPGVGLYASGYRGRRPGRLDPALPRGHYQAGGETLDIPLKRAGQGFVEVTQVERQIPLRRGPQAEVKDMGIAAQLHHQPAVRLAAQIAGHDRGGAPVVVPRRDGHALMPEGSQFGHADLVLGQDRFQRVVPAILLAPGPQRAPWHPLTGALPERSSLCAGRRQVVGNRRWPR